jgi:glucosamine--fructose-6-phosphate aminotransferase (isomerizing)
MLNNYKSAKEELISLGVELASDTDTELIAQFIGYYLNQGDDIEEAIRKTLENKVEGSWSLVIMHTGTPNKLFIAKNAGAMVVGLHKDFNIIASETAAFQDYTGKYYQVEDNAIVVVEPGHRVE